MLSTKKIFEVRIEQTEDEVIFHLTGAINETMAPFVLELKDKLKKISFIQFNLDGIVSINSTGTKEWARLMAGCDKVSVVLSNCPKVFIDQINAIKGFLPRNCKVRSFYVPYYCDDHGLEKKLLYVTDELSSIDPEIGIPDKIVEDLKTYDIDVIKARYLAFLKIF